MFPILFRLPLPGIGPVTIHAYGVLLVIAFLAAIAVARRFAKRDRIDPDQVVDLGVYVILAGLVGAKLLLLIVDWSFYQRQFTNMMEEGGGTLGQWLSPFLGDFGAGIGTVGSISLKLLQAGGVFYGGLITGILMGLWYLRHYGMPTWKAADVLAPAIAIAHAFGRLGCFAAGCCYGVPTDMPWGIIFTNSYSGTLVGVPLNIPLHPTQIYGFAANLLLFVSLLWFHSRKKFDGQVFWGYVASYAALRFILEYWRGDPRGTVFGGALSTSQFIAIIMVTLALGMLARLRMRTDAARDAAKTPPVSPSEVR